MYNILINTHTFGLDIKSIFVPLIQFSHFNRWAKWNTKEKKREKHFYILFQISVMTSLFRFIENKVENEEVEREEKEREKLINLLNFIESENELYIMFKKKLDKIEEWMCAE